MKKRKKHVEEHYDDCGELALIGYPDTDDDLEYEAVNFDLTAADPWLSYAFPSDVTKIARANPAAIPDARDPASVGAVNPNNSTCK